MSEHQWFTPDEYEQALSKSVETGQVSISLLQRRHNWGYGKSMAIFEEITNQGYIAGRHADGGWEVVKAVPHAD